jgi:hypothetical protein
LAAPEQLPVGVDECQLAAELLQAYRNAVEVYRAAVEALVAGRNSAIGAEERRALESQTEIARVNSEDAREALYEHRLVHGCSPFRLSAHV